MATRGVVGEIEEMEEFGHGIQGNNPGSLLRGIGNFLLESSRAFEEHPGNSSRSCQQSHTVETDDEQEGTVTFFLNMIKTLHGVK